MSYAPDESSTLILTEKSFLQGALLSGVVYGIEFTLFVMTVAHLVWGRGRSNRKRQLGLLVYSIIIFILGTLFYASNAQFTQLAFIDNRNVPGGPGTYEETMFSIPVDELGNVTAIMSTWMADALLLWRFYVIYSAWRIPAWAFMAFPSLLWLGSFVVGLLFLLQVSAASPWSSDSSINWTIPFFSLSLSLNIILTILIVVRLLVFRHHIRAVMGTGYGSQYASVAAMIVESAAIFSTFSLLFLVPFALNHPINEVFFQALSGVQIVATLLIIFRVAKGKSWESDTVGRGLETNTMAFAHAPDSSNGRTTVGEITFAHGAHSKPAGIALPTLDSMGQTESSQRTAGGTSMDALNSDLDESHGEKPEEKERV